MSEIDWWDKAVNDLRKYWEVDFRNHRVRLKKQKSFLHRYYLKWFKRFRVKEFYAWMQSTWATQEMMPHPTGIKHDDFKISKKLERIVPRGYQLQGGWTIQESDLKYLINGPLLSQDGEHLLVKPHGRLISTLLFISKYGNLLSVLLGIVGVVLGILALI